ncbi:hypothetical protein [Fluviicola taffensis]|uniref:Gliding motility-associated lipoprotein GldB n=1 Tax=Fluviicola taffensis (strain DSM 16823 / NCIMB 13979 / RW262) TaxID=755732 RepID=F2IBE7_FLUTR|nr:hypothetical protein [Fluviicola taffensis]AEA44255.1 hypothetical protein Fluta_2269 [Fluviicola taffensis DSM 16823]
MRKIQFLSCFMILLLAIQSCSSDALDVDISASSYNLSSIQLDSILQNTKEQNLEKELNQLSQEIPEIIDYEFYYCYKTGLPKDSAFSANWTDFSNSPYYKRLSKRITEKFPHVSSSTKTIEDGFKRLQVHLPSVKLPKTIVYMNSYFSSSVYCTENELAIGLERYLGAKTDVIKELPSDVFYEWIKEAMEPEYMERDAVCAWILTHICEPGKDHNNIQAMIQWGKILYLTRASIPQQDERILLRYNASDYQWAITNERSIWEHIVKQNMLFTKSEKDQAAFLQEGPFTSGLSQKGPDRLGQFLGYRIVCSYMEQTNVTLQQLLDKSYNEILAEYEIND